MADYKTQLENLKEAEKKAAITDLENTRNQTLSDLEAEQSKLGSTYDAKRTQTSNASKVNARNFQEYLANTGRANSGIGAQYEMGRQNSLNRDLNALNTAQAQDTADIERRRTLANNAYNTGLAGANAQVEANYIKNLLEQQQQQWENNMQLKQFNEQVRQFNLSRKGFSSGGSSSSGRSSRGNKKKGSVSNTKSAGKTAGGSIGNAILAGVGAALAYKPTGGTVSVYNTKTKKTQNQNVVENNGKYYYWNENTKKYVPYTARGNVSVQI